MLRLLFAALLLGACAPLSVPSAPSSPPPLSKPAGESLRVLSWNVSRDSFYEHSEQFRQILKLVDADVLILDELPTDSDAQRLAAALAGLGDAGKPWRVVHGSRGGRERSAIAAQRPLRRVAGFDQPVYPKALMDSWLAGLDDGSERRRLGRLLAAGISMVGARLQWDDRELLLVGLDLQCCGNGGDSWEESRRRYEASQMRSALSATLAEQPAQGIVVGGDFNAVNGPAPLLIAQGEKAEASHLQIVEAMQLDGHDRWTWDGRGTPFASGRLDYQMHDRQLRPVKAQVLDLDDWSPQLRRQWGVAQLEMSTLSPHRPVIVDYDWVD